ncbi:hypothetical protein [Bordetella holmesii]|uniref:Lipoprotein n=2 Tax=Bordetella holmesii TaxID=35814 RepID=A0ABN0RXE3_9BORD|nr:hypothetical protein [Bordetella holmesii]AHV92040.1 putative lipoprotein [Bordetella holmesii ATCC 51541]AIT27915.1 putative lipoprotein [Bordetella holmesii 44057]EWM40692.1 putative lipoprotein [Bordetella holmesii 35009]EWM43815.1 putative lipoprotein [Bordetella holmesii 41130]EWM44589.1 putative lipoprotein [Bordetella holmesii 70147]
MTKHPFLHGALRLGATLLLTAALAACGGSDHDDDSAAAPDNGTQPQPPAVKPELRCAP